MQEEPPSSPKTGLSGGCPIKTGVGEDRPSRTSLPPLVSIVTPAFNAARFIAVTIASARAQSFADWEMVIVDDASHDTTRDIIERLQADEPRLRLICNDRNLGVAASRNVALDAARGRWIAFLDSDDLWLPDKLAAQLAFAAEHDAAFVFGSYRRITEDGCRIGRLIRVPGTLTYPELLKNTCVATLTVLVDRHSVGPLRFPDLKRGNDFALWLRLLERVGRAHGLDRDLGRYRVVRQSLSSRKLRSADWVWRVYRETAGLSGPAAAWCFANYAARACAKRWAF